MLVRMRIRIGAGLLLVLAAAGCSAEIGASNQVSTDELSEQVSTTLTEQVGREPESVDCPDPLDAEEGAEVRCTFADSGTSYGVTVTVNKVSDDNVMLGVELDEEPDG
jgi:hypothetical protein